jgi:hypothetical protein
VSTPVNWKVSHTSFTEPNCTANVQVQGKVFVPVLAPGSKQVFVCIGPNAKNPVPVPLPVGTPGA